MKLRKGRLRAVPMFALLIGFAISFMSFGVSEVSASDDVMDFSMYHRASEVATTFGKTMAPKDDDADDVESKSPWLDGLTIGNAGGLLGYSRTLKEDEGGIMGWITSDFSSNTVSYSFDQLISLGGSNNPNENPLFGYALYGSQLSQLGLIDSSSRSFVDKGIGWLFMGFYQISRLVPFLFGLIMKMLVLLNPFQFFFGAIDGLSTANAGIFSTVADHVSDIYALIQTLSLLVLIPVFIGLTMISIFMFQGETGKKLLRVFVRVFMIFAGLPIIGATYTSIIETLGDQVEVSTPFADYIITSQFVDTEGWIKSTRLSPPPNSTHALSPYIDTGQGAGSVAGSVNYREQVERKIVYDINRTRVNGNGSLSAITSLTEDVYTTVDGTERDEVQARTVAGKVGADLLRRYVSGDRFSASDYEGFVKSQLDAQSDLTGSDLRSMFDPQVDDLETDEDYEDIFKTDSNALGLKYTIYNMSNLIAESDLIDNSLMLNEENTVTSVSSNARSASNSDAQLSTIGLSPLAMYNLLNTDFTGQALTVYSPKQSSSVYTANEYASVARVNTGFIGFVYGLESLVLLIVSAVVGIAYAIGLFKIIMSSLPQILSSVFGTAVGSMAMITKLLVSTLVLILEIIGTISLYLLFDSILMAVVQGTSQLVDSMDGIAQMAGGLGTAFVTIALGVLTAIYAISNRSKFGKMIEEVSTNIITKLMGGLDNSLNQGTLMHDQQAVQQAGQAGTVYGSDGQLGSEGSGIHDAEVAAGKHSGPDPDSILGSIADAKRESELEDQANINNPDYEGKSGAEIAKAGLGKFSDRQGAKRKDQLARGLGPLATMAAMTGSTALDGDSRSRLDAVDEQRMGTLMRSAAYGSANSDSGIVPEDVANESAIIDDIGGVTTEDGFNEDLDNIDDMSVSDILDEGVDEDVADYYNGSDVLGLGDEDVGTVGDVIAEGSESSVYGEDDAEADEAMAAVFGEDGQAISLDDETVHPDIDPLSDEYSDYIDGLTDAGSSQYSAGMSHLDEAESLLDEADKLDDEVLSIMSDPNSTDVERQEAQAMAEDASEMRTKAEEHQKQGASAIRKGKKLNAKRDDAMSKQSEAYESTPIAERHGEVVGSAMALTEAQEAVDRNRVEMAKIDKEIEQAEASGDTRALNNAEYKKKELGRTVKHDEDHLKQVRLDSEQTKPQVDESTSSGKVVASDPKTKARVEDNATTALAEIGRNVQNVDDKSNPQEVIEAYRESIGQYRQENRSKLNDNAEQQKQVVANRDDVRQELAEARENNDTQAMAQAIERMEVIEKDEQVLKHQAHELKAEAQVVNAGYDEAADNFKRHAVQGNSRRIKSRANRSEARKQQNASENAVRQKMRRTDAPKIGKPTKGYQEKVHQERTEKQVQNLADIGIENTRQAQKEYIRNNKELDDIDREMRKIDRELKVAMDKGQGNTVSSHRRTRKKLQKRHNEVANRTKAKNAQISRNISGLYTQEGGYEPADDELFLGKRVDSDINDVMVVLEDYTKNLKKFERLRDDGNISSTDVDRFRKVVDAQSNELRGAGFNHQLLKDSTTTVDAVKRLRSERERMLRGSLGMRR